MTGAAPVQMRRSAWARAVALAATLHRKGVAFTGVLETRAVPALSASPLFTDACSYPAVIRFSKTLGRRPPAKDWFGLALKVPGAGPRTDQDLLLVTSGWDRHWPRRSATCFGVPFSTVTPYRIGGRRVRLVALARPLGPAPGGDLEELEERVRDAPVEFRLLAQKSSSGWFEAGRLVVGERRAGDGRDLPYSPAHCGAGILPAGAGNALRAVVYATTQGARRPV